MSGYSTNGMRAFTGALTGNERIAADLNQSQGVFPETAAMSPQQIALAGQGATVVDTYAATTDIDCSAGGMHRVTLTGAVTFTFSNPSPGQNLMLVVTQDGTGSRTATWPASVEWPSNGTAPTLTTTAARSDVLAFTYDSVLEKWYGRTVGLNYNLA